LLSLRPPPLLLPVLPPLLLAAARSLAASVMRALCRIPMPNALARLAAAAVALTLLRPPPPTPAAWPVDSRFMLEPLLYLARPYLMLLRCLTSLRPLLLPAVWGSPSLVLLLLELLPLPLSPQSRALRSRSSSLRRITCDFLRPAVAMLLPAPAAALLLRRRSGSDVRLLAVLVLLSWPVSLLLLLLSLVSLALALFGMQPVKQHK
jgi:hypothetical protein